MDGRHVEMAPTGLVITLGFCKYDLKIVAGEKVFLLLFRLP